MDTFTSEPGFCPVCGSIFPPLKPQGDICCYNCKRNFKPDVFGEQEESFTVLFNSFDAEKLKESKRKATATLDAEGPTVERKCPKCGCEKMSYATAQLRSADEGQTVFYTCLVCKFKETENS